MISNHLRNVQSDCAKNTKLSYSYMNDRTINLLHVNKNIRNFTVHSLQCVEDTIILNIFQVIASLCYAVAPDQRQAIT